MAKYFAGGHLRLLEGAWRDDAGDPVDIEAVVRCRDCKNYEQNPYGEDGEMICRCWADWLPTEPDDFCSYGERKDGAEDG